MLTSLYMKQSVRPSALGAAVLVVVPAVMTMSPGVLEGVAEIGTEPTAWAECVLAVEGVRSVVV